jgi:D-alanyl-D-alanine carboxypeptidase/D-alanyl-D-alanine-endopeptidase (penicillin-binding protein 4)
MAARVACVLLVSCALLALPPVSIAGSRSHAGSLSRSLAAALAVPGVDASDSTAVAIALPSDETVFARNTSLPLEPASNEKLCVTYTALVELGPSYRFPTQVLGEGVREGTIWRGDLVLKGFGDPSLSSADLNRLVSILWREGIRKITGSIVGDASYFDAKRTAPGWLPSFAGLESPPLAALVVDRAVHDNVLVSNPPYAAAVEFDALLHERGILAGRAMTGAAGQGALTLATIYSAPLSEILEFMDQNSDNFTAEMVLKAIGAQETGFGTTWDGAQVVREALTAARVPLAGVRIVDGSGLSRLDRVTADELSALLLAIWRDPIIRKVVLEALPVAGESGTLADRMSESPALGRVHAKTGTTDIASALSGYVGTSYVFVAIENGQPVNPTAARAAQDRFAETLAAEATSR